MDNLRGMVLSVFWDRRSAHWTGFRSGDTGLGCAVLLAGCDARDAVPIYSDSHEYQDGKQRVCSGLAFWGHRFGERGEAGGTVLPAWHHRASLSRQLIARVEQCQSKMVCSHRFRAEPRWR